MTTTKNVLKYIYVFLFITLIHCDKKFDEPEPIEKPDPTKIPDDFARHIIQIKSVDGEAKFWNEETESQFQMRGVNYFWLTNVDGVFENTFFSEDEFDPARIRADFKALTGYGYNTVRIFLECNAFSGCIGNPSGGLNQNYLRNIATTLGIASEEGIHLILTSNDLPDYGGYWDLSNEGANENFEGYRNAHYLTKKGIESAQLYWNDLLQGLKDQKASFESVLAWSILNEQWFFRNQPPYSLTSGSVTTANGFSYNMNDPDAKKDMSIDGLNFYIDNVKEVIEKYDPNALVTMGFFVPDYPNPIRPDDFRYVETSDLIHSSNLDFYDFHSYPGELSVQAISENYGIIGYTDKPVIIGELGAFLDRFPEIGEAERQSLYWMSASCEYGYDGWLYWGLYQAPVEIGDATWGLFDESNRMLKSLSPFIHPDVCDDSLEPPVNIALNRPVTASMNLPDELPSNAVDGNFNTQWGSGGDPVQYLEIDLEEPTTIGNITLVVAQYPSGFTTHKIYGWNTMSGWELLGEFNGNTEEGDRLTLENPNQTSLFSKVRVETEISPSWVSWKEVEIYLP